MLKISLLKQHLNGFTLIELLVVISIIGVLSAVLLTNFVSIRERAKDSKLKSGVNNLKTALRLYYNDFQGYPSDANGTINGCVDGVTACLVGGEFRYNSTLYMQEIPQFDSYQQTNSGDGFILGVVLNNASDIDISDSISRCGVTDPVDNTFYICAN